MVGLVAWSQYCLAKLRCSREWLGCDKKSCFARNQGDPETPPSWQPTQSVNQEAQNRCHTCLQIIIPLQMALIGCACTHQISAHMPSTKGDQKPLYKRSKQPQHQHAVLVDRTHFPDNIRSKLSQHTRFIISPR